MKFNQKSAIDGANFGTNFIDESGNYDGIIISVHRVIAGEYTKFKVQLEDKDGRSLRAFLPVYGPKGEMFGKDIIMSAMGLLHIAELNYVPDGENGERIPELSNKPIAFSAQKDHYFDGDGKDKFNMNVTRFFHPQTHHTYSELSEKKDAKIWLKPVVDKDRRTKTNDTSFNFGANQKTPEQQPEKMPWEQ